MGGPLTFHYNDGHIERISFTDNFSSNYPMMYDGVEWLSIEQAYQASKFSKGSLIYLKIRASENYSEWVTLGQWEKPENMEKFELNKVQIASELAKSRVLSNPEIIPLIIKLKNQGKFEGNPGNFWSLQNCKIWNDIINFLPGCGQP